MLAVALLRWPLHVVQQLTNLFVCQMVAECRHPWFSDRCTAIFHETEEVFVRPSGDLREVSGTHKDQRSTPRAAPIGSVALSAVGEIQTLGRRRRFWYRVGEEQHREDGADQERQRRSDDDQKPAQGRPPR